MQTSLKSYYYCQGTLFCWSENLNGIAKLACGDVAGRLPFAIAVSDTVQSTEMDLLLAYEDRYYGPLADWQPCGKLEVPYSGHL